MKVSLEEARLLFSRWQEDAAPVRVQISTQSSLFDGVGVTDLASDALQFSGDSWRIAFPLEGAEFVFSDPREIPVESIREAESANYEFGVAVTLATGDRLTLLEMKREPD